MEPEPREGGRDQIRAIEAGHFRRDGRRRRSRARFDADRRKDLALSRANGIDGVLKAHQLDAILTPGGAGAGLAARAGYPIIVVPFGMVPNAPTPPFPAGFEARVAPFGVGFTGTSCSEPRLIELAYAFEQATKRRVAPRLDK
jgi:amidase